MKPKELASPNSLDRALDAALGKALRPPVPPADFRIRLNAAREHADEHDDTRALRARLERERREGLAELEAGYLRLRRRTLGTLIGGAFAAGAGFTLVIPWLKGALGADVTMAVAMLGALAGLVIPGISRLGRSALARPIQRLWES